jgi:replicative DNA helicase
MSRGKGNPVPSEKPVPQNIAAEEAVLGALLIDGDALPRVAAFLRPGHFYVEAHGWIFQAGLNVAARGEPVDVVTVCDELERQGQLEEVGGAAYVTALLNAVPTALHVVYYARLVERTAGLRQVITIAGQIARLAYQATGSVADVVQQAQAWLQNVVSPPPGAGPEEQA